MTKNNFKIFQLFDEIDHKTLRHYMGWRYFYYKIKMIIRYPNTFKIFLGLCGALFFMLVVPDTVYALTNENFDGFSDNQWLDNIGSWANVTDNGSARIKTGTGYSGTKFASSSSATYNLNTVSKLNITHASSSYFRFMMKFQKNKEPSAGEQENMVIWSSSDAQIARTAVYNNQYKTGSLWTDTTFINEIDYDWWYEVQVFITCDSASKYWKVKIDENVWSANIGLYSGTSCSGIGAIGFSMSNQAGQWYLMDDLYSGAVAYDALDDYDYVDPNVLQRVWEKNGGYDYIKMNKTQKCFINEACDWNFTYTNEAIELGTGEFFLIPYSAGVLPILQPATIATSSYLLDTRGYTRTGKFIIQNNATTEPTEYCVYYQAVPAGVSSADRFYCGYFLEFNDDDYINELLAEYNCTTICADIATSTDWTGGFWYGLECGARKVGCWALVPSKSSIQKFSNATQQLDSVFPFSVFADIEDIVGGQATTTIGISLDPLFPGDQSAIMLLDDTTIPSKFGWLWTTLYMTMEKIIYFSTLLYFITYFVQKGRVSNEETI